MRIKIVLLVLAGFLRLLFHVLPRPLTWDGSVYIGMAKAIVTVGAGGLWEPLRPLVWPLFLTPAALTPLLFVWAHLLQFLFGMGIVVLVYLLARDAFGERAGLWALGFAELIPLLAFYEHQLLTEQPATFFALLAIWFATKHKCQAFFAGLFAGLSFLTKFPQGLIFAGILFTFAFEKRWKHLFELCCGFTVPVFVFIAYNSFMYHNPLASVIAANDVIQTSGLWLYHEPFFFYAITLVTLNIFFAFTIPGMIPMFKKNKSLLFSFLLVFAYWSLLPHKEFRFIPLLLPFVAVLAAGGWNLLAERAHKNHYRTAFLFLTCVLLAVAGTQAIFWTQRMLYDEGTIDVEMEQLYKQTASGTDIVTSDPRVAWFTNKQLVPLYYPLFPQNLSLGLAALEDRKTLLFNPCDTPCSADDVLCLSNVATFEKEVRATWTLHKEITRGSCRVMLFSRP